MVIELNHTLQAMRRDAGMKRMVSGGQTKNVEE
jgi:hypothetical protein